MEFQQPIKKGFFAKYWWLLLSGAVLACIALVAAGVLLFLFVFRGNANVTEVSLSTETIVYGQPLDAVVKVENSGLLDFIYHASLMLDGKEGATQDIILKSKNTQVLELNISGLEPGLHTISIGGREKEFKVLRPASFIMSDLAVDQDELMMGGDVTVSATVSNTGEVEGTYVAKFTYDGGTFNEVEVKLGPEDKEKIEAQIAAKEKGIHTVGIEDLKKTIAVLSPANIELKNMNLSSEYAKPNEAVTVEFSLVNSGDEAGQYSVKLLVNGKAYKTQEVTVEANSQKNATINVTQAKAGKYVLTAEDITRTLQVVIITRPANGTKMVHKVNSGRGRLAIVNNNDQDAVIILTSKSNPKAPLLMVYVRAKSKVTNIKVKDGTYLVFMTIGTDWDSISKRFIKDSSYERFDETAQFKTTRSGGWIYWSSPTITLGSSSGSTPTSDLDENNFPR